jgi:hypothetical protein
MAEAAQARGDVALSTPSLMKLVRLDLAAGEEKGLEDYRRAGRRLQILKERIPAGQWQKWLRKQLDLSVQKAWRYMKLAERTARLPSQSAGGTSFRTLSEATGDHRPHHQASWYDAAREEHAQREQRAQATAHHTSTSQREARWAEQRAVRAHADGIINAGYRAYAPRFHPDRGGDPREMVRVNKARDGLRRLVKML